MPETPMEQLKGETMSAEEIDAFLRAQGTGVLALARDNAAYAVPISFGYADGRLYFVFFRFRDESTKEDFAAGTDRACLVTYEVESVFRWRSVVVVGPLDPVDPDRWDEVGVAMSDNAWSPDLSSIGPRRDAVGTYALTVEDATGRLGHAYV